MEWRKELELEAGRDRTARQKSKKAGKQLFESLDLDLAVKIYNKLGKNSYG